MAFNIREMSREDISGCRKLLSAYSSVYDSPTWEGIPRMWEELLVRQCALTFLVEDTARPAGTQVVAFGITVFAHEAFALECKTTLGPYLGSQISRRYMEGRSPILSARQIAEGNSAGNLTAVLFQGGWDLAVLASEQGMVLQDRMMDSMYASHRGYQLKELMLDAYGDASMRWFESGGCYVRRDYADWYARQGLPRPSEALRPWLMSLTREEAIAAPGCRVAQYFVPIEARIRFNPSEKEMLRIALDGQTDEELAESLAISLSTVKKRWRAIYNRVDHVDPTLMATHRPELNDARGGERRRHLLRYLRHHLEEIRPTLERR